MLYSRKQYSMGPYHHSMAHRRVGAGGDGLQIWRVAVNILNKQSWMADGGVALQHVGWLRG
jgi:hypothetical protein